MEHRLIDIVGRTVLGAGAAVVDDAYAFTDGTSAATRFSAAVP